MAEKQIGGLTYRCQRLPADKGLRLALRCLKIAGPALPHVLTALKGQTGAAGLHAIADMIIATDTDEAHGFITDFVSLCEVQEDGQYIQVVPGHHFGDDIADLLECFIFALEAQLSDFFTDVRRTKVWETVVRAIAISTSEE